MNANAATPAACVPADPALTAGVAAAAAGLRFEQLPGDAVELVRQCVLDTLGVAIAGAADPTAARVRELCLAEGGRPAATLLCHDVRLSPRQAALVNGTAAHALDYDDCNLTMPGHVSAAVLPAVLALAEARGATGRELITAFAAGFEAGCSIGAAIAPGHYGLGFHATGTNGALGAAAGCARLLGLPAEATAHALGIAATTASGLKGLFGTMCKPFHAGRAAENGVLAAELAAAGFLARTDALECQQGYAQTHSPDFDPSRAAWRPSRGWHLFDNLFKFHAACYGTHGAIECALRMRGLAGVAPEAIRSLVLEVAVDNDKTCNIAEPASAAQARFSLRHVVAMALAGHDTSSASAYGEGSLADPGVARLRELTEVKLLPGLNIAHSFLTAILQDGSTQRVEVNAGLPAEDLAAQRAKLERKFRALVAPVLGQGRCDAVLHTIGRLEQLDSLADLVALHAPASLIPEPSINDAAAGRSGCHDPSRP